MSRLVPGMAVLLFASVISAQQQPKGVPARSNADDYKAHISVAGVTYAASVVPANELKHLFAFDITKNYVVLEVAVYPRATSTTNLDPDGFLVRSPQMGDEVRTADSATVASVIQQKNAPQPGRSGPVVEASTEVGYESGRDPYTGQRVHGTYTATQVGVGSSDRGISPPPGPGGYPQDRALLEGQLWQRSLPGGQIQQPVAGYLYFPASLLKKSKGVYVLEYADSGPQPVLTGARSRTAVQLPVPVKNK